MFPLLRCGKQQEPGGDLVDASRYTVGHGMNFGKDARIETRPAMPAHASQAVVDILFHLIHLQRAEMMHGDNASAQWLQLGMALQAGAKFGRADQQDLQQRPLAQVEIGQLA